MGDYTEYTIGGYNSLPDIEGSIREKEAGGFKFRQNRVVNNTNVVMFEKLPFPERPKPDIVFRAGQAPSGDGMQLLWKGTVATSTGNLTVCAYR
jgi:hypothetical protein